MNHHQLVSGILLALYFHWFAYFRKNKPRLSWLLKPTHYFNGHTLTGIKDWYLPVVETCTGIKILSTNWDSNNLRLLFEFCYSPESWIETCQGQEFSSTSIPPTILFLISDITTGGIAAFPQVTSEKNIDFSIESIHTLW